eukprot:TRINITY_DN1476_c1_g1_i2.p1 TRINITY_DN1476_c1_g1~~TRINITY_DN1476_c1_g1_i2.p1  ORF type:complete len:627 (+),score=195.72 TRINITY_DN1476_c1_g1_i2:400-2280(+)
MGKRGSSHRILLRIAKWQIKTKKNKEFNTMTSGYPELRSSKHNIDAIKGHDPPRIPILPPKPVKDKCIVQYPYVAQNEDELSLMEGQILNIISKDSEDKGWWRGELDGRIGVFPDNFVKMVEAVNHQERLDYIALDKGGNYERGSREKICSRHRQQHSPELTGGSGGGSSSHNNNNNLSSSTTPSSKKGSFGKANPPPKPKAPPKSPANKAVNIGQPSRGSFLSALKPSSSSKSSSNRSSFSSSSGTKSLHMMTRNSSSSPDPQQQQAEEEPRPKSPLPSSEGQLSHSPEPSKEEGGKKEDFDGVSRCEKLAHPTADRVRGPKRRPPSSIFTKDMIALEDPIDDDKSGDDEADSAKCTEGSNTASIGGCGGGGKDVKEIRDEDPDCEQREEPQLSPSHSKSSSPINNAFKEELQSRLDGGSEPSESAGGANSAANKKPDWLEELSRKQANRKSGFFNDKTSSNIGSGSGSSMSMTASSTATRAPPALTDKPQLPTKPSQIRDDLRKLTKRSSNAENSGGSDKENNKPNRGDSFLHSESSQGVPAEAKNPCISDESLIKKSRGSRHKSEPEEPEVNGNAESSLEQRVCKLESTLSLYAEKLVALEESLRVEREERLKLQEELNELRK